jgi:hypothetical protein
VDDAGAGGKLDDICYLSLRLQEIGPSYSYFPEASKKILMPTHSLETARTAFADLKFTVVTGSCYLGGFI